MRKAIGRSKDKGDMIQKSQLTELTRRGNGGKFDSPVHDESPEFPSTSPHLRKSSDVKRLYPPLNRKTIQQHFWYILITTVLSIGLGFATIRSPLFNPYTTQFAHRSLNTTPQCFVETITGQVRKPKIVNTDLPRKADTHGFSKNARIQRLNIRDNTIHKLWKYPTSPGSHINRPDYYTPLNLKKHCDIDSLVCIKTPGQRSFSTLVSQIHSTYRAEFGGLLFLLDIYRSSAQIGKLSTWLFSIAFLFVLAVAGILYMKLHKAHEDNRQQREELCKNEEQLEQLTRQSRTINWEIDKRGVYTYISRLVKEEYGYEPNELIGQMHFSDLSPDRDRNAFKQSISKTLENNSPLINRERCVQAKDGKLLYVHTNGIPLFDENGTMRGYCGNDTNITDHVEIERKLQESKLQAQEILNSVEAGVIIVDESTHIIRFANAASARMAQTRVTDMLGKICHDYICPNEQGKCPISDLGYEITEQEKTLLKADGTKLNILKTVQRINYRGGKCLLETFVDITKLNESRQAIEDTIKEAEKARKVAEQTNTLLQAERDFSASIIHEAPAIICGINPEGICTFINPAGEKATGYTKDEILGKNWWTTFYPGDAYRQVEQLVKELFNKPVRNFEMSLVQKGGGRRIISWNLIEHIDSNGEVLEIIGFGHDITESKNFEDELRRVSAAVECASDAIGMADANGQHVYQNRAFTNLFGYSAEDFRQNGGPPLAYADKEVARCVFDAILKGESWDGEVEMVSKDKKIITCYLRANAIKDDSGAILGVIGVHTDITEKKNAEARLQAERVFTDTIIESVPGLFFTIDSSTQHFIRINANWKTVTGYTDKELDNIRASDIVVDKELSELKIGEALNNGWASMENSLITKSGEQVPYYLTARRLDIDGTAYLVGLGLDISSRKRAEEEIRNTNIMLAEQTARANDMAVQAEMANAAKSEFLANMSHEIRTPMTAILGFTETILDPELSDEDRLHAAHTVRRNGEHLLEIINDILDISKIEAGKLGVERMPCSPVNIVAEVQSLMQVRADAKNLTFHTEYVGEIPETINSDPTRLKQILVNLVGNAIKFTETGGVRLIARLTGSPLPATIQFDVVDTGIGLTDEQIGKLFKPFSQADTTTTRQFGGTGLGLMISKRLAQMLGGDLIVYSKLGEGSTFRVTVGTGSLAGVPMLQDPAAATVAIPMKTDSSQTKSDKLDCRILLAEDGPDNQRLISFLLKKAGARVTVVENGKLAVEEIENANANGSPYDIILMDMQMPVMDGYEAVGLLRQKKYAKPIIALTAHAMAGDRQKCMNAGCDDYATKPVDRKKLISLINRWHDQGGNPKWQAEQSTQHVGPNSFIM